MHEELKTFLVGLAHDLDKLTAYITDPAAAFQEAGLSEEDKTILRSGDQNRIYAAIANPAMLPSSPPEQPKPAQPSPFPSAYGQPAAPAASASPWGPYAAAQSAQQPYAWPTYAVWQWPQIPYAVIQWPGQ